MVLLDVNVLVYAHREDAPGHAGFRDWLGGLAAAEQAFGLADLALAGFVRVVTHPRVFARPTPIEVALQFVEELRALPQAVVVAPGSPLAAPWQ